MAVVVRQLVNAPWLKTTFFFRTTALSPNCSSTSKANALASAWHGNSKEAIQGTVMFFGLSLAPIGLLAPDLAGRRGAAGCIPPAVDIDMGTCGEATGECDRINGAGTSRLVQA